MSNLISLLIGVAGSLVASAVWMWALRFYRPKIAISEKIAWDGCNLRVKVVNRSRRAMYDLRVEAAMMTPKRAPGGVLVNRRTPIRLVIPEPLMIPAFDKNDDQDNNAHRFALIASPSDITSPEAYLRIRVFARDELTGLGRVVVGQYYGVDILSGEFMKGQRFDVVSTE